MSDAGTPIVISDSSGPEAEAFLQLAQKVAAGIENSLRPAPKIVLE